MDNIDPFIKVLHIPSMTKIIQELNGSCDSLDPNLQALILAISLAALMCLEDRQVSVSKIQKCGGIG